MEAGQSETRKKPECLLCRNHQIKIPRVGHVNCNFKNLHFSDNGEICQKCEVTKFKRNLTSAEIKRKRSAEPRMDEREPGRRRRNQECRKCRHHREFDTTVSGGHNKVCPRKYCSCMVCMDINSLRETSKNLQQINRGGNSSHTFIGQNLIFSSLEAQNSSAITTPDIIEIIINQESLFNFSELDRCTEENENLIYHKESFTDSTSSLDSDRSFDSI